MDTLTPKQKYYETVGNTIIQNLKKRQIEGYYCEDKKSALKKALELIPIGASISWGGSMTIIETGLLDAVKNGNYIVIDRDKSSTLY